MMRLCFTFGGFAALFCSALFAQELTQVHQDFSQDPGWEGFQNRIVAQDPPRVKQDFGWVTPATHFPGLPGEIGGSIWTSTTPAWYAMPIGRPLSFKDRFFASGKIAFPSEAKGRGSAFLGFFNHARQEWRPWSSLVTRFSGVENGVKVGIDYMSAAWGAGGMESDTIIPADGSIHSWRMDYDPDATAPSEWPDAKLKNYLTNHGQTVDQILEKARQAEPEVTREQLQKRLMIALREGLIDHLLRREELWSLHKLKEKIKGIITFQIDEGIPYRVFMRAEQHVQPVELDRFGIFNAQTYHRPFAFYVADLTVNGQKLDLSKDPNWEGHGNRIEFAETDFQRCNFGFSETNWAGEKPGEIGGTFYRLEPVDPLHGYYADDIGKLTLDDPISFAGSVCFTAGNTDAGMFFGYFNAQSRKVTITDPKADAPSDGLLGIEVDGPTRIGYYFTLHCSPTQATGKRVEGPIFHPTGERHKFSFDYDPKANDGLGRITLKLDDTPVTLDLTAEQRKSGATFDRFGLASKRAGGKYVTIYFDDLTYTARRGQDHQPVFHKQEVIKVPYPSGGRAY
jgi:hypothetical protein